MLSAQQLLSTAPKRRPLRSLRQQYDLYIMDRIEHYKNRISPRRAAAPGRRKAMVDLRGEEQFLLTEVLAQTVVDEFIKRRLGIKGFESWRKSFPKLRAAQRDPTHWGLDANHLVASLAPRVEPDDAVLVVGAGAEACAYLLAAHDGVVTFLDKDFGVVERAESRIAMESLSSTFEAVCVQFGQWLPCISGSFRIGGDRRRNAGVAKTERTPSAPRRTAGIDGAQRTARAGSGCGGKRARGARRTLRQLAARVDPAIGSACPGRAIARCAVRQTGGDLRPAARRPSLISIKKHRAGKLPARRICTRRRSCERGENYFFAFFLPRFAAFFAPRFAAFLPRFAAFLRAAMEPPCEVGCARHRRTRDVHGDVPGTRHGVASAYTRSKISRSAQYPPGICTSAWELERPRISMALFARRSGFRAVCTVTHAAVTQRDTACNRRQHACRTHAQIQ